MRAKESVVYKLLPVSAEAEIAKEAVGYTDALHGLCVGCHENEVRTKAQLGESFAQCLACHSESDTGLLKKLLPYPAGKKGSLRASAKRESHSIR